MRRVELHVLIAMIVALFTVTLAQAAGQQGQNTNANQNPPAGRGGRGATKRPMGAILEPTKPNLRSRRRQAGRLVRVVRTTSTGQK